MMAYPDRDFYALSADAIYIYGQSTFQVVIDTEHDFPQSCVLSLVDYILVNDVYINKTTYYR